MNNIEIIICLVLLFMVVPDLCAKVGRPALAFSAFVVLGFVLRPAVPEAARSLLHQAGQVGFLLLLFEVGLEIDLPPVRELARPLRFALIWSLAQYPIVLGLGRLAGLNLMEALTASASLTACSVGMAYPAWKNFPGLNEASRPFILRIMVALETLAIVLLAVETTTLGKGLGWNVLLRLLGIIVTVWLVARFSKHLNKLFQMALQKTTRWRVHMLVLLVLAVCAVGERLGLDAAKTAFFLGLFMRHIRHQGRPLADFMAPISHQFLIPLFFVGLGLEIDWNILLDWLSALALGTAAVLLLAREVMHRRWLPTGGGSRAYLILCPNLTMVALAANAFIEHGTAPRLAAWLVLTGLLMTVPAILLLPSTREPTRESPATTG